MNEEVIKQVPELAEVLTDLFLIIGFWKLLVLLTIILLIVYSRKIIDFVTKSKHQDKLADVKKTEAQAEQLKQENYRKLLEDVDNQLKILKEKNIELKSDLEYWKIFALRISEKFQYSISLDKLDLIIDYTTGLLSNFNNEAKSRILGNIERGTYNEDIYKLNVELHEIFITKNVNPLRIFAFRDEGIYSEIIEKGKKIIDEFVTNLHEVQKNGNIETEIDEFIYGEYGIRNTSVKLKHIIKDVYTRKLVQAGEINFQRRK